MYDNDKHSKRNNRWRSLAIFLFVLLFLLSGWVSLSFPGKNILTPKNGGNGEESVLKFESTENKSITAIISSELLPNRKNSSTSKQPVDYDGVAVTLMLGSPKWFQRRYSIMINQVHAAIPDNWIIQIFYIVGNKMSEEGIRHNGVQKRVSRNQIILTPLPSSLGTHVKRKDLLRMPWLWENMVADRVFLFGGNSVLCADSKYNFDDFAQYDYVGSPWQRLQGKGGSGEMSLRSRSAVLDFIRISGGDSYASASSVPEDIALVSSLSNVAPLEATLKFAVGSARKSYAGVEEFPLGIVGTMADLNDTLRAKYIDYCPEIKMIYPVLSSADCFGAQPKPLECFKYLCENGMHCKDSGNVKWKNDKMHTHFELSLTLEKLKRRILAAEIGERF